VFIHARTFLFRIEYRPHGDGIDGGDHMPLVKCSVSNCSYWTEGNECGADLIMIEVDEHADAKFNEEYAGESFDSNHRDVANDSSNTCCHTFKPKSL
jgi:hypothetical protein